MNKRLRPPLCHQGKAQFLPNLLGFIIPGTCPVVRRLPDTRKADSEISLQVLDQHASLTPHRLYASLPHSTDIEEGFRDVKCCEMANAVNGLAHWLDKR